MEPTQNNPTPPTTPSEVPSTPPNTFVTAAPPTVIQPAEGSVALPTANTEVGPLPPPAPIMPPTPSVQGVQSGGMPPMGPTKPSLPLKRLAPLLAIAVLVLGVGGYIFGFYLPNQPDSVWQSGLKNSGKAIRSVALDLNEKGQLEKLKKTEMVVTGEIKGKDFSATVNSNSKLDTSKTNSSGTVTAKAAGTDMKLTVDLLTDVPKGKIYPDVYFRIGGLKSLGSESLLAGFGDYDNKWISVKSDYIEEMYKTEGGTSAPSNKEQVNSGDVAEAIKAVSDVSNEYLFSSSKDKAVLENKEYKGKETVDGVSTYHYIVGVNKDHMTAYCKALTLKVNSLAIAKKLQSDAQIKQDNDNADKDCKQGTEDFTKDNDTFDAWVDTKYKLMHKVRLYEATDKKNYVDFGQNYKGGKDLSLFVANHDDAQKSDVKFVMDLNSKNITSKGTLTFSSKQVGSEYDGTFSLEVKPYSGEVKVEAPAGAVDIRDLLGSFGGGYDDTSAQSLGAHTENTAPVTAADIRRQVSISTIKAQLETYKTRTGYYPTLAQLNDASWRKTNLSSLDQSHLKDPSGTTYSLAPRASDGQYGYQTTGCTLKGCKSFVLEALLSNGAKYTKTSAS